MKIGHASYGYYDTRIDIVMIGSHFIVVDFDYGIVCYAKSKEDVLDFCKKEFNFPVTEIEEIVDIASHTDDYPQYKKGEK